MYCNVDDDVDSSAGDVDDDDESDLVLKLQWPKNISLQNVFNSIQNLLHKNQGLDLTSNSTGPFLLKLPEHDTHTHTNTHRGICMCFRLASCNFNTETAQTDADP